MAGVRPKKALGQHFLTDLSVARRIAGTVSDCKGMPVLEVGPGMGVLTRFLLDEGHDVTVVEIDTESVDYLKTNFPALRHERIVEGDFLDMDLHALFPDREFVVIGNFPYNISSQIFFKVLDYKDSIPCCAGMLQREVAERLAAAPGSRTRGILSVLLQAWYEVEYLFTVSENVFNPPPKVKSGVVRMRRRKDVVNLGCDEALFKTVVKTTFGQRRKTIRNSLRGVTGAAPVAESPLLAMRPEQLSVAQFVELTNLAAQALAAAGRPPKGGTGADTVGL
ncbi:MAG: 16S rRNA (adenine(1518)-N(6)/adenine(1519)-N(6))-dimethyltransferase RsmA [Bacteroidales bacterium]|nr:16S rRNA (adenine(1518)-N(6)/adenine(1519)-N(6))-dimethyltransferase RsmA [Bacteroidales bacterium]